MASESLPTPPGYCIQETEGGHALTCPRGMTLSETMEIAGP